MIVALAGRKQSGKSTLANELTGRGFILVAFAGYLKGLVRRLYGLTIEDVNDPVLKEKLLDVPLQFNEEHIKFIEKENNIIIKNRKHQLFHTPRNALQYIGSDVLRDIDEDFHVKKLESTLDPKRNYVICDCRFDSELKLLKSMNALCIFIIRPGNFIYDNHYSEISLNRNDFEYIIINGSSKKTFINSFLEIFKTHISEDNKYTKEEIVSWLEESKYNTSLAAEKFKKSRSFFCRWSRNYGIILPGSGKKYAYNDNAFYRATKENSYIAGLLSADGCLTHSGSSVRSMSLELTSHDECLINKFKILLETNKPTHERLEKNGNICYSLQIKSPFITEDIKLWCIEPRKSKFNKVPDCIKDNKELMGYWLVGLIDGDGCVYNTKQKNKNGQSCSISINVLASLEIVKFISGLYPYGGIIEPQKYTKDLYNLRFNGKNAVELCKHIPYHVGLQRKWSKIEPFLDKVWQY